VGWWVSDLAQSGQYALLISWVFWVIFSITLHELAHGWAALWQGDDTPRRLHRMTANPLVHMGHISLIMFAIVGIAWGMMPTDPSRYRWRRRGRIVVAGAGPAMNVALAVISLTCCALWVRYGPQTDPLQPNVEVFLLTGGWLNILLAAFNLLPVPPLDGSSILSGLSMRFYIWFQNPRAQMLGMFVVLALFLSGVGGMIFGASMAIGGWYVALVAGLLP
jgi:Zn-dependent protease